MDSLRVTSTVLQRLSFRLMEAGEVENSLTLLSVVALLEDMQDAVAANPNEFSEFAVPTGIPDNSVN